MRIAIVINTSWNIFNFRKGLVKAFLEAGNEVIAIAPRDDYSEKLVEMGCTFYPISIQNKGSNPIKDLGLLLQLHKAYKKIKPDIILHYTIKPNIYGSMAARLNGVPVINNVSGLGTVFLHQNLTSFLAKKLYRFAFQFPEKIFFQNSDDLDLFVKSKLVKKEKTGLLPGSGVDTELFYLRKRKEPNEDFVFLMVSRLLFDKGIVEYIEAIRLVKQKFPKTRFQVVGAIDETGNLGVKEEIVQNWVKEGLIEYYAFTDELIGLYHQADCVVLPSYREGTPRSLLEAASCGIPLVSTNVPGCKDVTIEGYNGFLCEAKDFTGLAETLGRMLLLAKQEYFNFSENSRKLILAKYDEKIVIKQYFDVIKAIIAVKGKL